MTYVDLGVDYDDVKDLDEFPLAESGTYQFVVDAIDIKKAKNGRPMLLWWIVVRNAAGQKVRIPMNTVLPWKDPSTGELSTKGCGGLISITKALGNPWTGKGIETAEYIGKQGSCEVAVKTKQVLDSSTGTYVDDPSGKQVNDISKFHY